MKPTTAVYVRKFVEQQDAIAKHADKPRLVHWVKEGNSSTLCKCRPKSATSKLVETDKAVNCPKCLKVLLTKHLEESRQGE